jgi:hypothetical protein
MLIFFTIEVKSEKKKPMFMSHRQILRQDHDVKRVNKCSEVWNIYSTMGAL